MHKITISFLAAIISLAVLSQPSDADVTVTYRGSFAMTGYTPRQAEAERANAALNATCYFKGSTERIDIGNGSIVAIDRGGSAFAVNTVTRRYRTFDMTDLRLDTTILRLLRRRDPNCTIKMRTAAPASVVYLGHRCKRYVTQFTGYWPKYDTQFGLTFAQTYATDFPGIHHNNWVIGNTKVTGVLVQAILLCSSTYVGMSARTDAVSISSVPLSESTFAIGKDFSMASSSDSSFGAVAPIELSGFMSAKPVDPYANLNQFTGAEKAQKLITAGNFDQASDVVHSLAKRGLNTKLGPIYNLLGDHSNSINKRDEAWGWYSLAVTTSDDPNDIVHAHFALADYYTANHDIDHATKQLQAVLDLPTATQADKDNAGELMKSMTHPR